MSRITASCINPSETWVKTHQDQIQKHPAWHGDLHETHAEALLNGRDSFTYLLRTGEKEHAYFITFVKEDLTLKHQRFTLELDLMGWFYRNGTTESPREVTATTLEELICQMTCCDQNVNKIFSYQ